MPYFYFVYKYNSKYTIVSKVTSHAKDEGGKKLRSDNSRIHIRDGKLVLDGKLV
jgi:hypothetical protein